MTQTMNAVAITGNTYPVRRELRDMGGEWDGTAKAWMVPADKAEAARELVGNRGRHGERAASRPSRRSYGGGYRGYAGRCACEDYPCCGH